MDIALSMDAVNQLEKRFGQQVRYLGQWNTDGVFAYVSIPIAALDKAAAEVNDPALTEAVSDLKSDTDRATAMVEMIERFGPDLIGRMVSAYRDQSVWREQSSAPPVVLSTAW